MNVYAVAVVAHNIVTMFEATESLGDAKELFAKTLAELGLTEEDKVSYRIYQKDNITVQILEYYGDDE